MFLFYFCVFFAPITKEFSFWVKQIHGSRTHNTERRNRKELRALNEMQAYKTLPLGLKDERKLSQSGTEEGYWALWKPLSPLIGPITTSRDLIRARKRCRQSATR